MSEKQYTASELTSAGELFSAITSARPDKAAIASMMAEAFINGMNAKDMMDRYSQMGARPQGQA